MNSQFIVKNISAPPTTIIFNNGSYILISACTLNFNSSHIFKKPSVSKKLLLQINSAALLLILIYRESTINWTWSATINLLHGYLIERIIFMSVSLVCLQLTMSSKILGFLDRFSWFILSAFSPVQLESRQGSDSIFRILRFKQQICISDLRIGPISQLFLFFTPLDRWLWVRSSDFIIKIT